MSFPFLFGPPPTPEEEEEMRARHERRTMENEAFQHGFQTMFDEMPLDHLRTLRTMLSTTCGDQHTSTYFEGMVVATMKYRFGVCMTHGTNHDEELPITPPTQEEAEVTERMVEKVGEAADEVLPIFGELSDGEKEQMKRYHLDDLRDEDTHELLGFICTGINGSRGSCGHVYVSIEDRMLRDTEECSACFVKQATG
jgi:hypothetical protein